MTKPVPTEQLAYKLAREISGSKPVNVVRFATGSRHYVYDVQFEDKPSVVLRIGDQSAHAEMKGAVHLSKLLRPLGVPLPNLLSQDISAELPWIALERFAGTDLGAVFSELSPKQRSIIAQKVANAQMLVSSTDSADHYGYAVTPENALQNTWSDVLIAHLERSKKRIISAALFNTHIADHLESLIISGQSELNRIKATPFLHDTTTKNVIVDTTGNLSGIVDVDDLCFGDPRYTTALTHASLLAAGHSTEYTATWLDHINQPDDQIFRLYVASFLLDFMSEYGQTFNGNQKSSTPEERKRLQHTLQQQLNSI